MGLFDELDIASAKSDPFGVEPGTYGCTVKEVKTTVSKDKFVRPDVPKVGLSITYLVTDDSQENGSSISEYKEIPQPADPSNPTTEERRAMSFLKQRLLSLGVPENKINEVEGSDLEGIDCFVTVKQNGDYRNVTSVKVNNGEVTF